eukprot:CAMPEP_0172415074 /NCGR_PEP_ID=MMETSP1064-20121228/1602_1 /TAXON_ID=202472 /ORGANISM="Aulacoseira subarctica , Strain CCAP 1002/5" /LENGTH=440 /DNA_ID=CAMNT_0013151971 /DNA_START=82 /DNA_END=1404 /DNA_ORIENTATION=+
MGNGHSSTHSATGSHQSSSNGISVAFRRTTGSLGLNRAELDRRCQPSGLYPSCSWDDRVVRRLIGDGKLAARMRGTETREKKTEVECPICFLYYEQVNSTQCCKAFICTECFLQFNPSPSKKHSSSSSHNPNTNCDCPFCNAPQLLVQVSARDRNMLKNAEREEEEQKIAEARIRREFEEKQKSIADGISSEFGQSLVKHSSIRKMTTSSDGSFEENFSTNLCVASVEERLAIEEEMKRQHLHPLVRRIQEEAEEASNARAQEFHLSNRGRRNRIMERFAEVSRSSLLSSGRNDRDWDRSTEAVERGEIHSIDDLLVIEAAILLSMEDAARRRGNNNDDTSDSDNERGGSAFSVWNTLMARTTRGDDSDEPVGDRRLGRARLRHGRHGLALSAMMAEEAQVAMAIALSLQDVDTAQNTSNSSTSTEQPDDHSAGVVTREE